tara:strand:+ start:452 stop:583 length:132 start_codon:yes stop_codon:yes gene_type:complete
MKKTKTSQTNQLSMPFAEGKKASKKGFEASEVGEPALFVQVPK